MRVATKYPRIAARHLEETGRQAEIVEVKGSVELAPLTGMVEAIVDLTATGTTLRENNLVVREEIVVCTARLIANPVAHKLKAARDRRAAGAAARACRRRPAQRRPPEMRIERLGARGRRAPRRRRRASAAHAARAGPRRRLGRGGRARDRRGACARRATTAVRELHAQLRHRRQRAAAAAGRAGGARRGDHASCRSSSSRACRWRSRTSRRWPQAGVGRGRRGRAAAGPARDAARGAGRRGRGVRARRPRAVPEHGRDGRRHRARGGRARRRRVRAAGRATGEIDPAILGTCRLCGVERVYRMGGAQAIAALAYGTETVRPRRRDRRPGQPVRAGGQAPALGDASGSTASPARATCWWCSARRPATRELQLAALDMLAQAEHGAGSLVGGDLRRSRGRLRRARGRRSSDSSSSARRSARRRARSSRSQDAREALELANAFAPEHLQLIGAERRGARAVGARAPAALFVGAGSATAFGDYVAGSNHVLPTGGAARFASGLVAAALPPADGGGADRRGRGRQARGRGRADRARRGLRGARRVDAGARAARIQQP